MSHDIVSEHTNLMPDFHIGELAGFDKVVCGVLADPKELCHVHNCEYHGKIAFGIVFIQSFSPPIKTCKYVLCKRQHSATAYTGVCTNQMVPHNLRRRLAAAP